ncbi:MAG TPA: sugar diacid recognition domain-containing protein [Bacillales bacterium]|nr:sugar diacid recognition domain-containing protein [Bacillales bacterium]
MLTSEIARNIVQETMQTLGRNINIMNEKGIILGSGDPDRIDTFHEAAGKVVESGKPIVISEKEVGEWEGTRPGVNLPIKFQGHIIGVVGISGAPSEVEEFGALVVMMTELMVQQIYLMKQVEWKHRTREFLLEEILRDQPPFQKIEQKCRLLKIELIEPFEICVLQFSQPKRGFGPRAIYEKIRSILTEQHCVYGYVDTETFVILLAGSTHPEKRFGYIREKLGKTFSDVYHGVRIGFGREAANLDEVNRCFKDIRMAMGFSERDEVQANEYEQQLLLHQTNYKERQIYKQKVLKSLPEDFRETLVVFFENDLNLSRTAKQLFIHRNTLIYRMDRIKEITGYDPRRFKDAVTLQMADWCREIQ